MLQEWILFIFVTFSVQSFNISEDFEVDTVEEDPSSCLALPLQAISAAMLLIKSKHLAFAFTPSGSALSNCVAKALFMDDVTLPRPFSFWEVSEDFSYLESFQNRSTFDGVTVIPLDLPDDLLSNLIRICDTSFPVVQWLWIGNDADHLAVIEESVSTMLVGCRFYSLLITPCNDVSSLFLMRPCPSGGSRIRLIIPEVPVSLCRIKRIQLAEWTWTENVLRRTLLRGHKELVFNKTILIGTITMAPFMVLGMRNGQLHPEDGIDEGLIKCFSNYLTFNYSLRAPTQGLWGREVSPGIWSGLVGLIQRAEVDYGFTALSSTFEKQEVIDFSIPNFFDAVTFLTTKPTRHPPTYALIQPFSFLVWVSIAMSLVAVSLVLWLLSYLSQLLVEREGPNWTLLDSGWYLYGALTQHGSGVVDLPSAQPVQIVIGFWWILCLIFFTGYSGNLISFLNIPLTSEPVDNTGTLLHMVRHHAYKIGTIEDSQVLEILDETNPSEDISGIFQVLRQRLSNSHGNSEILVSDHKTGIIKSLHDGNFALISAFSLLEADAALVGFQNVLMAKDRFYAFQYALGFPKGSLFTEMIGKPLRRLMEGGIMGKGWRDMVERRKIIHAAHTGINESGSDEGDEGRSTQEFRNVTLSDLQGVFLILLFGDAISLAMLLGEMVVAWNQDGKILPDPEVYERRPKVKERNRVRLPRRKLKERGFMVGQLSQKYVGGSLDQRLIQST